MDVLRDIEQLTVATTFARFRAAVRTGGVRVHRLDERVDLDALIADLVMSEVLSA